MTNESTASPPAVNPLPDIDFDVRDPDGWYRYVADSLVLTGLARRSGEAYAREMTPDDVDRALHAAIGEDGVDFGKLDEELQAEVVRDIADSDVLKSAIKPASLSPHHELSHTIERNKSIISEAYSLSQYGHRLMNIYETMLQGSGEGEEFPFSAQALLNEFLSPERFTLLRT